MSATPSTGPSTADPPREAVAERPAARESHDWKHLAETPEFRELHANRRRFTLTGMAILGLLDPPRGGLRELQRVGLDERRLVAAVLDPGDQAERVEELPHLVAGRLHDPDVARRGIDDVVHSLERVREPGHGGQRRSQIVTGERDEASEALRLHGKAQ